MTGTCRQGISEGQLSIDPAKFQQAHIRLHVAPSVTSKTRSCIYACYNLVVSTHTAALLRERRGITLSGFSAAPTAKASSVWGLCVSCLPCGSYFSLSVSGP